MSTSETAIVDLDFPLRGPAIPADHGYALYSAISRLIPTFHGDPSLAIHPIRGQLAGERQLALTRSSRLTLRLPPKRIPDALPLAGRRLDLGGSHCLVGVPSVRALSPAPSLLSRLVVIRGFLDPDPFLEAVRRQLDEQGIVGSAQLLAPWRKQPLEGGSGNTSAVVRRTLQIHGRTIVGFAVHIDDLSPSDSLRLQRLGIGGRQRFGCGVFAPTPKRTVS